MTETASGRGLPTGTVTFLRTDIEGSMALARGLGSRWDAVNDTHLGLIRAAVEAAGGVVVRTEGDGMLAVVPEAGAAVDAAVAAQRALAAADWPSQVPLRVRMGLHSGEAHLAGDDYGGLDVGRAARVAAVGHGGQIVMSATTIALVADRLPPGVTLRDLGTYVLRDVPRPERLAQLDVDGLPSDFPPLRAAPPDPGDLPARLTSFIGRDREIEAVTDLIASSRLVTLSGPGGIGKSSLAVEVARRLAPSYRDGAWFVALESIDDPGDIEAAIAAAIGLVDGPERSAATALPAYLAERSMLLVLDNIEHVLEGAGSVATVLRVSPETRVLATSRAPLRITGEQEYPVPPLDGGRSLFIERARAVRPGWDPGADAAVVDEICALVDGLPLGIELAAARTALLPVTAIRDRLAARSPLPGVGARDLPARQRTLEATVAWSRELLEPRLQELLDALAVFDGGFDLDQVVAVAGPSDGGGDRLDDLLELADQSLVVPVPEVADRVRFRLLRTIETSGLDRLAASGREPALRRRHAEAYLELVREAGPHLNTSRHVDWIKRVSPEQANLRAALRWSIDRGAGDLAIRLTGALWRFWHAFGQVAEGRALAERVLAMPEAPAAGAERAWAEAAAGNLAYWQGDMAAARDRYAAQIRLATDADDPVGVADAHFNYGHVAFLDGLDRAGRKAFTDEVIARYRALGDERGEARAAWTFAIIAMSEGDLTRALEQLLRSREDFARLDDRQYQAMTEASLGWVAFMSGDTREAIRCTTAALLGSHAMSDLGTTTISLHVGVLVGAMTGRFEEAAEVQGAFDALCDRYGVRPPASLRLFIGDMDPVRDARDNLDPEVYDAAYQRGRRLSLDDAVDLVVRLGDAWGAGQ